LSLTGVPDFAAITKWKAYLRDGITYVDFAIELPDGTERSWYREIDVYDTDKETVLGFWEQSDEQGRSGALNLNNATAKFLPWCIVERVELPAVKKKAKGKRADKNMAGDQTQDKTEIGYVIEWLGYRETSVEKEAKVKYYWPELLEEFERGVAGDDESTEDDGSDEEQA